MVAGAVVALVAAVAVGGWMWLRPRGNEGAAVSAAPAAAQAKPLTEAQQLVAKARRILDEGDELNRETYVLAEELLRKAEAIDVTEGSAWGLHVRLSTYLHVMGLDRSPARLEAMQSHADRALKLAPDSVEAQIASAQAQMVIRQDLGGAQARLQALAARYPRDARILRELAWLFRYDDKLDEALAVLARAREIAPTDKPLVCDVVNCLILSGRFAEADGLVTQAMTAQPVARMLAFDVWLKLYWNGDLAGVPASLQRWPAWFLREDRGAGLAAMAWQWRGDAEQALTALGRLPRDYVRDYWFTGPRAVLSAWAHERAGHAEAARADWQIVVQHADRELAAAPDDPAALHWKAWALARLGDTATAERMLRLLEERRVARGSIEGLPQLVGGFTGLALMVGQKDRALDLLTRMCAAPVKETRGINRAALRNNPHFEPLRSDPRFQALVAAAPAPELPPVSAAPAAAHGKAVAVSDEKTLLVLPLENQSPDPSNTFFTDGLHAEVIETLARVSDLKVVSRDSALTLKGSAASLQEKAQRFGAGHVLSGSVRRAEGQVRVLLTLRRANDEEVVWQMPRPTRSVNDALTLQSEIAEEVARALQARYDAGRHAGARFLSTNPTAYDLYLKAFSFYNGNASNPPRMRECLTMLEEALRLDAQFMPAARLAGRIATRLFIVLDEPRDKAAAAAQAKKWSELASQLMPGGAGDAALAFYLNSVEGDEQRALRAAENAIRALPRDVEGYHFAALALRSLGRLEEAAERWAQAEALDVGGVPSFANHIATLAALRRREAAEIVMAEFERVKPLTHNWASNEAGLRAGRFSLDGTLPTTDGDFFSELERARWLWRQRKFEELRVLSEAQLAKGTKGATRFDWLRHKADALVRSNRPDEARAAAREALALAEELQRGPRFGRAMDNGRLAIALAHLGRSDEALAKARAQVAEVPAASVGRKWTRQIEEAEILAFVGRKAECVALLRELLRVPSGLTVPMLKVDPAWDNVREEPAFQALLADPKNSAPL